jgi:hypothetical protein
MSTSTIHSRSEGGAARVHASYPVVLVAASLAVVAITAAVVSLSPRRAETEPGAAAHASRAVGRHAVTWRKPAADRAVVAPSAIAVGDAQNVEASIAPNER